MAHEIIDRVDRGPYGSSSKINAETRPADFTNAIRQLSESHTKSSRSTRDSRMNRENVSLSSGVYSNFVVISKSFKLVYLINSRDPCTVVAVVTKT